MQSPAGYDAPALPTLKSSDSVCVTLTLILYRFSRATGAENEQHRDNRR
jgi:hypothetical protein